MFPSILCFLFMAGLLKQTHACKLRITWKTTLPQGPDNVLMKSVSYILLLQTSNGQFLRLPPTLFLSLLSLSFTGASHSVSGMPTTFLTAAYHRIWNKTFLVTQTMVVKDRHSQVGKYSSSCEIFQRAFRYISKSIVICMPRVHFYFPFSSIIRYLYHVKIWNFIHSDNLYIISWATSLFTMVFQPFP